jgi:hypothetical protein
MNAQINWSDPQDAAMGKFIGQAMATAFEDAMLEHGPADAVQAWADAFMVVHEKVHRMLKVEHTANKNHRLDREWLNRAATLIKDELPDGFGFILLAFNFGPEGHLIYTSNAERKDAIAALKEWLLKVSPEEWLKHIE